MKMPQSMAVKAFCVWHLWPSLHLETFFYKLVCKTMRCRKYIRTCTIASSNHTNQIVSLGSIANDKLFLTCARQIVTFNATTFDIIHKVTIHSIVEGSPIVSSDGFYTFVVSNAYGKNNLESWFHIIRNYDGSVLFSERSQNVAYAPLGVARGNYDQDGRRSKDVLVWGEKFIANRGVEDNNGAMWFEGKLHSFQFSRDFDGNNTHKVVSRSGDQINKVTSSAPLVPKHGQGAILACQAGRFRGWSKGE
jgi:hypothetical protein